MSVDTQQVWAYSAAAEEVAAKPATDTTATPTSLTGAASTASSSMNSEATAPPSTTADASTVASAYALPPSAIATATAAVSGAWSFEDTEVAARFDREALCHIPDYVRVIEASVDAVEKALAAMLQARDEAPASGTKDISDGSSQSSNGSISQTTGALWKLDPSAVTPEQAAAADVHYTPAHALRCNLHEHMTEFDVLSYEHTNRKVCKH